MKFPFGELADRQSGALVPAQRKARVRRAVEDFQQAVGDVARFLVSQAEHERAEIARFERDHGEAGLVRSDIDGRTT